MKSTQSSSRRAFTLVEIMIVVLIIGILLTIATPAFLRARMKSQATACRHNLTNILSVKERWAMDLNRGANDTPTWADLVTPGVYLKSQPICPNSGTYTIGDLSQVPTCSIGNSGTPDDPNDDHIY
jgi:prepilin-type N-terminal cleavage/methylation domain-containing protein